MFVNLLLITTVLENTFLTRVGTISNIHCLLDVFLRFCCCRKSSDIHCILDVGLRLWSHYSTSLSSGRLPEILKCCLVGNQSSQHWDSWDWNFENFEKSFDLVDVLVFWLFSARDFLSWSTCNNQMSPPHCHTFFFLRHDILQRGTPCKWIKNGTNIQATQLITFGGETSHKNCDHSRQERWLLFCLSLNESLKMLIWFPHR